MLCLLTDVALGAMIGHIRKQFLLIADRRIGVIAMVTQPEKAADRTGNRLAETRNGQSHV